MNSNVAFPTLFGRATAAFSEHARLHATLLRLRELCILLGDQEVTSEFEPHGLLDEFREQMVDHFAAEEAEDYFGTLASEVPSLAPRIALLEAEHWQLIETVDQLQLLSEHAARRGELIARLGELLARFEAHERDESAILQDFFLHGENAPASL